MDYTNQQQGTAAAGQAQDQPQAGGFYQFQPGVGFVQVQGPSAVGGMDQQGTAGGQEAMGAQTVGAQAMGAQTMGTQGMDAQSMGAQAASQQAMGAQAMGQQAAADGAAQAGMFGQQMPEGAEPKFDQEKLGKMYSTVTDVMNGDADPASLIGLFADNSGDFWKGALVGAAAVVLLNNDAVKGAIGGLVGSVGTMFGDNDPEGEQVTVGGK